MFGALVLDGIFVLAEAEISGFWRWSEWHLLWWPWFLDECWWKDDELPCVNLWLFCLVCWTWRSLSYPHMCILYLLQILIAYYMYIYTVETQIAQRQIIYECTYVWIFLWYYGIYILYILSTMNNVMLTSCPWWNTPRKSAYRVLRSNVLHMEMLQRLQSTGFGRLVWGSQVSPKQADL